MKRLYLLLLSGLLLASCVKEELPQPSEGEEPLTAAVTRSAGEKDPYSRESCWNRPISTYAFLRPIRPR